MSDSTKVQETGNGPSQVVSDPDPAQIRFTMTEPDKVEDGEGDWSFSILADKDVFLASISYATQADAMRGRIAMEEVLKGAVFIATSES